MRKGVRLITNIDGGSSSPLRVTNGGAIIVYKKAFLRARARSYLYIRREANLQEACHELSWYEAINATSQETNDAQHLQLEEKGIDGGKVEVSLYAELRGTQALVAP